MLAADANHQGERRLSRTGVALEFARQRDRQVRTRRARGVSGHAVDGERRAVYDDVLGVYAAIDPTTGRTLWSYDPEVYKGSGRPPNLGFTHRGVAYWVTAHASASSAARTMRG